MACKPVLREPFAVINADDYYGRSSFQKIMDYLSALPEGSDGQYCLAGFRLGNTLSDNGGVTRGLCKCTEDGRLLGLTETWGIVKTPTGAAAPRGDVLEPLDCDTEVSMNMWGFTPDILEKLDGRFQAFLDENLTSLTAEFILPEVVDALLQEGKVQVQVLPTEEQWYGMTFGEDAAKLQAIFAHKK